MSLTMWSLNINIAPMGGTMVHYVQEMEMVPLKFFYKIFFSFSLWGSYLCRFNLQIAIEKKRSQK